jgi:predicted nucleic acid-binding protein
LWRPTLRDPSDEMVLETAVNGRADWLLTFNDKDFVGAERFGVKVGRPGPVWRLWKGV